MDILHLTNRCAIFYRCAHFFQEIDLHHTPYEGKKIGSQGLFELLVIILFIVENCIPYGLHRGYSLYNVISLGADNNQCTI